MQSLNKIPLKGLFIWGNWRTGQSNEEETYDGPLGHILTMAIPWHSRKLVACPPHIPMNGLNFFHPWNGLRALRAGPSHYENTCEWEPKLSSVAKGCISEEVELEVLSQGGEGYWWAKMTWQATAEQRECSQPCRAPSVTSSISDVGDICSISDVGDSIIGKVRNNVCRTFRTVCGLKKNRKWVVLKWKSVNDCGKAYESENPTVGQFF